MFDKQACCNSSLYNACMISLKLLTHCSYTGHLLTETKATERSHTSRCFLLKQEDLCPCRGPPVLCEGDFELVGPIVDSIYHQVVCCEV